MLNYLAILLTFFSSFFFFFFQMYENFVEEVDAVDNGISQYDGEARYTVGTTLSARVSHLNPWWNSDCQDTQVSKENGKSLSRFQRSVNISFKPAVQCESTQFPQYNQH